MDIFKKFTIIFVITILSGCNSEKYYDLTKIGPIKKIISLHINPLQALDKTELIITDKTIINKFQKGLKSAVFEKKKNLSGSIKAGHYISLHLSNGESITLKVCWGEEEEIRYIIKKHAWKCIGLNEVVKKIRMEQQIDKFIY